MKKHSGNGKSNNQWFFTALEDRIVYCGANDNGTVKICEKDCSNHHTQTSAERLNSHLDKLLLQQKQEQQQKQQQNDGQFVLSDDELFISVEERESVVLPSQPELFLVYRREVGEDFKRNFIDKKHGRINFKISKEKGDGSLYYLEDLYENIICVKFLHQASNQRLADMALRNVISEAFCGKKNEQKWNQLISHPCEQDFQEVSLKYTKAGSKSRVTVTLKIEAVYSYNKEKLNWTKRRAIA